jgi:chromosome segregation ATPase
MSDETMCACGHPLDIHHGTGCADGWDSLDKGGICCCSGFIDAQAAKLMARTLELAAENQTLKNELESAHLTLEAGTRFSIALQAEVHKYKDAAEAWTVMVDEQAAEIKALKAEKEAWGVATLEWNKVVDEQSLQIHNLQMDKISLNKQIKGLYDGLDEARDEHARLSDELMDVVDEKHEALKIAALARGIVETFADDLESSKYTVLIGQELRNRWKAGMMP